MRLTFGILCWNEAERIEPTIESLFAQSLFTRTPTEVEAIEVVCVPNGCTDDTAGAAARAFAKYAPSTPRIITRVHEIAQGGKANAWNVFIHEASDPAAEFIFMMDADIQIVHPDTLVNMLNALRGDEHAYASAPLPLKHTAFKKKRSLMDRLSLAMSGMAHSGPRVPLPGCLYCARASVLRDLYLPTGIIAEDSFLKIQLYNSGFREAEDYRRVIRAPDATLSFETYTALGDALYHQKRRAIARVCERILYEHLRKAVGPEGASPLIRQCNAENPNWLHDLIYEHLRMDRWWVLPPGMGRPRFAPLKRLPWWKAMLFAPVAAAAHVIDLHAMWRANRAFKNHTALKVWRRD